LNAKGIVYNLNKILSQLQKAIFDVRINSETLICSICYERTDPNLRINRPALKRDSLDKEVFDLEFKRLNWPFTSLALRRPLRIPNLPAFAPHSVRRQVLK